MSKNKWYFFLLLFLGLNVTGQSIHYFISGESSRSSSLRNFLVVVQLLFGLVVALNGWKKYRKLSN